MAAEPLSRGSIPPELLGAKRAAAARFLVATGRVAGPAAFAVSTRPEHNVVGVGIGYRIAGGEPTDERAIRLYVERKVARDAIPSEFRLPETIEGVPTDVIQSGRFVASPAAVPLAQRRLRPARPGCSIGFQFGGSNAGFVMAGTFGAVVEAAGVRYILSNNHVLADENNLPLGSPIFQPGLLDGGDPAKDQIAQLSQFVQLRSGLPNSVDCAIAAVTNPADVRATFLRGVGRLQSTDPIDAAEGMQVHKHGRTTGYTKGSVFDVSADVVVQYEMGQVTFQDQVLVRGDGKMFSDSGDSGSVIVDRASKRATALLFAGSPSHTVGNPISDVLAQLGVSLVR